MRQRNGVSLDCSSGGSLREMKAKARKSRRRQPQQLGLKRNIRKGRLISSKS